MHSSSDLLVFSQFVCAEIGQVTPANRHLWFAVAGEFWLCDSCKMVGDPFHIGTSFLVLLGTLWNNWREVWEVCPFQESQLLWPQFSDSCITKSRCGAVIELPTSSCVGLDTPHAVQGRSMESPVLKEIRVPLLTPPTLCLRQTKGMKVLDQPWCGWWTFTTVLRAAHSSSWWVGLGVSPAQGTWLHGLMAEVGFCFSCGPLCWRLFSFVWFPCADAQKAKILHPLLSSSPCRDLCCYSYALPAPLLMA